MASIGHHLLLLPPPLLLPIRRLQTTTTVGYTEVSTREATWVPACDESGKEYTDIIYEKAVGEGIAKGNKAFCSGGDQALRSSDGYADFESFGHLNVLDLQVWIPRLPKPVIAMTGPKVVSFILDLVASYLPTDVYAYSTHWLTTQ
ncbi:hypothetical protein C4D60_Mb04t07520 [Musa balbisiana]|uniref:Uncharacterized protein n=1 Tax=Musa balbisiana TaxID=52838 RepID=A0A4S8KAC1_MUSBA|nr:hypothetical protein C4D60_Mb04t07520 [Musa balbisiana]